MSVLPLLALALLSAAAAAGANLAATAGSSGVRGAAAAAKPHVRWFVTSEVVHQPQQLAFATSKQADGVLPCCHLLKVDSEGELNASSAAAFWAASNFTALRAAGKQVIVDIGGDQTACESAKHGAKPGSSCAMWENRAKLRTDIAAFAQRFAIDGFTLDWEFGQSFDYLSWNRTWAYIAAELAPAITFEVCINSVTEGETRADIDGGDPSGNPFFRPVPWASRLTDMGSYSLCRDNNCTEAERQYNLTTNLERYDFPKEAAGWAGGLEGVSTNLIKLAGARADQLSPGLWFDDVCAPTGDPNV